MNQIACVFSKKRKHNTSLNLSCICFSLFLNFHQKPPKTQTQPIAFTSWGDLIHPSSPTSSSKNHPLTLGCSQVTKLAYLLSQGLSAVECRKAPIPAVPGSAGCCWSQVEEGWVFGSTNLNAMDYYGELIGLMADLMVNYYETVLSK